MNKLYAQQSIKFKHLKVQDGLSQSWVKTICQDQEGFIWFGTNDGLNKYDGYSVKSYYQISENKYNLLNNSINIIFNDSRGNLWIGTDLGFCLYDHHYDQFIHRSQWSNGVITQFLELTNEQIFIATLDKGLFIYDLKIGSVEPFIIENDEQLSKNVICMLKDSRGNIWFGTTNGLVLFNPLSNKLIFYNNEINKSHTLSSSKILSLLEDKHGRIWAGTDHNGLFCIQYDINHPEKTHFSHFVHNSKIKSSISAGAINALLEDKTGRLWIGIVNGGLNLANLNNPDSDVVFHHYQLNPYDNTSLSNNSIHSLVEDSDGGIWIGTYGDGVNYYHPQKEKFVHIKQQLNHSNSLNNNFINVLYEEDELLWIGTENGINLYNKKDNSYHYFVYDPNNKQTVSSNAICSIFRDSRHNLWVGTWAGGLNLYNSRTNTFTHFKHDQRKGSISNNNILNIYEDQKGILWICTMGGGINQFDYNTKTFNVIGQGSDDSHRLTNNSVNTVLEDSFGKIWISTTGGVDVFDRITGTFKHFLHDTSDTKSVSGIVFIFFEDSQKNLWLGTNNGLNIFNRNTNNFKRYTIEHGLPNNQIKGILEDAKGNLWISTNKGLSKFVQATRRLNKPIFKNYNIDDGLQNIEFTVRSCWHGQDGKMYFGGNNGFNVFHPDSIKDNVSIPPITITNFLIDNRREPIHGQNSPLSRHDGKLRKVTLNHRQSVFTVEYVMLNYFSSNKNKYAYMLEGFDKDWNYVGNQRFATYTNLDPGEYIFHVKGTINNDWNQVESSINIEIIPPLWKTSWAYLFYFIFTGFIFFNVWRFQLNKRALKHELILEHQHAEKLEELNKMKSHFFANITHEFRSPLTLIMGPMQQFISGEVKENFQEIAKMTLRNSKRMYYLINQILELSKLETGFVQLQTQKTDIVLIIDKIMRLYASFAESKNINLQFIVQDDLKMNKSPIELYFDVDKIQKVIENLLSNALKYTPQNGNISVSIKKVNNNLHLNKTIKKESPNRNHNLMARIFQHTNKKSNKSQANKSVLQKLAQNGYIEICVKDDGIGIHDKDLNKIFDRFYQGINLHNGTYESVGIGLALTKELVELHSGTIHVKSVYEQGTTFYVRLPLGRDHLLTSEIIQNSDDQHVSIRYNPDDKNENIIQSTTDEMKEIDKKHRILIVDDNADIRKYVVDHLKNEYRIITAIDGKEGLKKAKSQMPELIVSDVNMPQMNGIDLCLKIKRDVLTCHIPIILLTVRASKNSKIEGLEIGADDYITKPFEIRELKARIRNLLEQRRQLKKKFICEHGFQPSEIASNSIDEQLLNKALSIVETNISESLFGVEELSKQMSISRSQLYRKIRAITGQTPVEFIRSIRLNRAAQLLKQKHDNIGRIAYEVGFSNPSYFSNSFYKQFGVYPTEYAKLSK